MMAVHDYQDASDGRPLSIIVTSELRKDAAVGMLISAHGQRSAKMKRGRKMQEYSARVARSDSLQRSVKAELPCCKNVSIW